MSDRWWSPTRPTVTPDAVVLAMCEPGDLGAALLAAHRAGAACIETVAKQALPSEETLIDALITGRGHFAPPVVEAVSKNLDHTYSDLLVRDWLDDAEQTAVTLFRTAVTKGVSPSVAATRAGQVFGVPARDLGTYFVRAIDPKSPAPALLEQADQVLMNHVASVVALEAAEVVAKATMDRPQFKESDVVRDARGRFADEPGPPVGSAEWIKAQFRSASTPAKVGDLAREEVAAAPTPAPRLTLEEAAEQGRRTGRSSRTGRQSRQARVARADDVPALEEKGGLREKGLEGRGLKSRELKSKVRELTQKSTLKLRAEDAATAPWDAPLDVMAPFVDDDPEGYETLLDDMMITTSREAGRSLIQSAARSDGHFRMGHLSNAAAAVSYAEGMQNVLLRGDVARQAGKDAVRREEEAGNKSRATFEPPAAHMITVKDLAQSPKDSRRYTEDKLADVAERAGDPDQNHTFLMNIYAGPKEMDREREDDALMAIVHFPGEGRERLKASIDEYVIGSSVRGRDTGGFKRDIEFDPNQTFMLESPIPEKFWDPDNEVIVNRFTIIAVDDDTGYFRKATAWRESEVRRDEKGQFAVEDAPARRTIDWNAVINDQMRSAERPDPRMTLGESSVRGRRTGRAARQPRATRDVRMTPLHGRPLRERELAGRTLQARGLEPRVLRSLSRSFGARPLSERVTSGGADLPMLNNQERYVVLSAEEWDDAQYYLDDNAEDLRKEGSSVELTADQLRSMVGIQRNFAGSAEVPTVGIDEIAPLMMEHLSAREGSAFALKALGVSASVDQVLERPELMDRFTDQINAKMTAAGPRLHRVEVIQTGDRLHAMGHFAESGGGEQALIQVDRDFDPSRRSYLSYIGTYSAVDLAQYDPRGTVRHPDPMDTAKPLVEGPEGGMEGSIPNPPMKIYRLSAERWSISN